MSRPTFRWVWCVATFFAISTVVNLGILLYTEPGSPRHSSAQLTRRRMRRAPEQSEPLALANSAPKCMNRVIGLHKEHVISNTGSSRFQEKIFMIQTCESVLAEAVKSNAILAREIDTQRSIVSFLSGPVVSGNIPNVLHAPRNYCGDARQEVIVAVVSVAEHFHKREIFRNASFGNYVKDAVNNTKLIYIIGVPKDRSSGSKIRLKVKAELENYDDILQTNVDDSRRNDALKIMVFYDWASEFCSRAKYVIVARDDVTVDLTNVVAALKFAERDFDEFILGRKVTGGARDRDVSRKEYASEREYPNATFPSHLHLGVIAHPVSTMRLLYQAALRTSPMTSADVFFTGVCARKVNVSVLDSRAFY